jgi:hypothetical protein
MNIVASVEIFKRGVNQKTGKSWTMYQVTTEDGTKASGFDLVKVGEPVELEQKGEFLNYHPVKEIDKNWPEEKKFKNQLQATTQPQESPVSRFNGAGLDERQRAIIRQHSQSMAIEVLKIKQAAGGLEIEDLNPAKLKALADYFDKDVLGTAE